jgi:hypothetical protein
MGQAVRACGDLRQAARMHACRLALGGQGAGRAWEPGVLASGLGVFMGRGIGETMAVC